MATPVEAPKLGNTVEECLVSRWVKHRGDTVAAGDVVAEIETDKATFEVTSPVNGVLLDAFFDEGALVPVFTNLFVIGADGEDIEAFRPGAAPVAAGPPAPVNGPGPNGRILEQDLRALFRSGTRISKVRERIARRMRESLATTAQYT